jgi:hypothetical protein
MNELETIQTALRRTARRDRCQRAWRGLWSGFLAGSAVLLAALILFKTAPVPILVLPIAGCLGLVLTLGGALAAGWHRSSLMQTARWLDDKQGLRERLSTAIEVGQTNAAQEWKHLVVADAARRIPEINPGRLLPFHLPRPALWSVLLLALASGLGFVPEYRSKGFLERQRDADIIKDTGQRLAELTRRSLENHPAALEPVQKSLEAVTELGEHLAKAQITRAEALKDISSVAEKLKEQVRDLGRNPAFQSLQKAARSSEHGGTPGSSELQKQIDSLQKSLANQPRDPDALSRMQRDVQKAREAAAGLPASDSPGAAEAREQLEQTLSNLSRQAAEMGLSLPNLDEAIAALAASQTDQLVRDMKTVEADLEKLQAMAQALKEAMAQADKMGKDLPEQLELGQAEAAQSRLKELAEKLRKDGPDSEVLKKMADEIGRAIHPAGQYGKAAQFLKEASQKMEGGRNQDAAESLLAAAKELGDLLQQMGDTGSMMASLSALQRAQMAIGSGKCWGQCNGPPRAVNGGGVGKGVGTWADDSRWLDLAEVKDRWDNSGVVRDDRESKGISDRGDAQTPDGLAPTKIKGQINPGGPMPSISLKGVSIKGMSRVDLQEVTTAAQSAAQSALSQEQVPRAYRGAVKGYFDDLKKQTPTSSGK